MKLSAICVSHSSRFGLLQRAIFNFLDSKWNWHDGDKELIIVVNQQGYYDQIRSFLADPRLKDPVEGRYQPSNVAFGLADQVKVRMARFRETNDGVLKALSWARGDIIACWDDDNLSHPDRLIFQVDRTDPARPSVLGGSFSLYYYGKEVFLGSFAQPAGRPSERCAVGSLICYRDAFPDIDINYRSTWSTQVIEGVPVYDIIYDNDYLFMRGSNGNNATGDELCRRIGTSLPATWTRQMFLDREEDVRKWLSDYRFDGGKIHVAGKNAGAYDLEGLAEWPAWMASPDLPEDWKTHLPTREIIRRLQEERRKNAPQPTPEQRQQRQQAREQQRKQIQQGQQPKVT